MTWELFDKRKPSPTAEPRVTIQKNGIMTLNNAARQALGDPDAVNLYYDSANRRVGFRRAQRGEENTYNLRRQGRTTTYNVSGQGFVHYYGLTFEHSRRYVAKLEDDILAIDLDAPVDEYK